MPIEARAYRRLLPVLNFTFTNCFMNLYYCSIRSFSIRIRLLIIGLLVSFTTLGQTTWTGTTNANWDTPTNWSTGVVPDAAANVIIPNVSPSPVLSTTAGVNSVEVQSGASFSIGSAGSLTISGSRSVNSNYAALSNNGTVQNSGQLVIATTSGVREYGIRNSATFNNNTGGNITIDNASQSISAGVYNKAGTFTNTGRIAIGGTATVGLYGIFNNATFNNDPGGDLSIDNASSFGLYNGGGTFANKARLTIGTTAGVGQAGISIANGSVSNTGCDGIIISNYSIDGNGSGYGSGSFTNSGKIIENSGGNSYIHTNSGLVQNLNGGTFTIPTDTGLLTTTAGQIWTGCTSSDWNTATNWSANHVPLATDDVVIPIVTTYPVLSTTAVVNSVEVSAASSFTITAAGSLTINGSKTDSPFSYAFLAWGSVSNSGQVVITMTGSVGQVGLFNRGGVEGTGFTNNAGASVKIDGSSYAGIYNTATFNNGGTITIGASTPVGSHGVYTSGGFYNNTGGILSIDRSTVSGFYNPGGISPNDGTIMIGSLAAMGVIGYYNSGFGVTTNSGIITIDHTTTNAFLNNSSFKNTGTITIGALGPVGDEAIRLTNTFTNDGCGALVDIQADAVITTTDASFNRFSNSNGATIIERASGTSTIYNNSGLIRNLNGGTFTITNSNTGLLTTAAGDITANPSLTITQGQSTTLTAQGSAPYTWSSGQSTQSIEVTTSGPYSVTSTIAGCTRVSSVTVTVNAAPLTLAGFAANPSTVCVGSPVTFTATVENVTGSYAYTLTNGSTSSQTGTSSSAVFSQDLNASGSGPQTFTLTVSSNGQSTSATTGLTVSALPSATITPSAMTVCAGTPVSLTASEGQSYLWNTGETTRVITRETTGPQGATGIPGSPTGPAGPYSVTVTNAGGCSASATITLTINPVPTASISPQNLTVCAGTPASLTASGGTSYLWNTGATTPVISVTATGVYSVTVTGAAGETGPTGPGGRRAAVEGCSNSASTSVTVNSTPTPTLTINQTPTSPGSATVVQNTPGVTLTASGCSGTLAWTGPNNPTGSTITVPTSATGTLSYTVSCQQDGCSSPPASFTVYVTPPTTTGNFDGFVNGADCGTFRGWAWDRNKPNTVVSVEILDGSTIIGTLPAGDFRQDLLDAGKGNGKHAFRFTIPERVKDGLAHNLSARVAGSSFILKDSPKALICTGTAPEGNKPPQPPTPTVLNAPLTAQVDVPFSGTLVAFTDPEGTTMSYGLSELPTGLSLNPVTRVISGTPTVAGSFVLTYSATDEGGANNSVSFVLTINPAQTTTVTGNFEGYLDKVECGTIRGWVWDRNKPNTPVTVEFYTGSTVWGSVVANIYRVDLKNAGKGNGAHAYSFDVPAVLKDGNTRLIYGRVQGSTFVLKDSGKPLTCNSPTRLSAETASNLQVTVLGNPVSGTGLSVEIRGAEGQPLRLQLTDATGREMNSRLLEKAGALEQQRFELGHRAAGFLFLQVSTPTQKRTIKILTN